MNLISTKVSADWSRRIHKQFKPVLMGARLFASDCCAEEGTTSPDQSGFFCAREKAIYHLGASKPACPGLRKLKRGSTVRTCRAQATLTATVQSGKRQADTATEFERHNSGWTRYSGEGCQPRLAVNDSEALCPYGWLQRRHGERITDLFFGFGVLFL